MHSQTPCSGRPTQRPDTMPERLGLKTTHRARSDAHETFGGHSPIIQLTFSLLQLLLQCGAGGAVRSPIVRVWVRSCEGPVVQ